MAVVRSRSSLSPQIESPSLNVDDDFDDDGEEDSDVYANAKDYNTIKAPKNKRISEYCEKDTEAFIFSKKTTNDPKHEHTIIKGPNGLIWSPPNEKYTCQIMTVKKEKAMLGMKTNVMYQLIPTFSNIQVSRKFSQFEWLSMKLSCKYSTAFIPPLPDRKAVNQAANSKEEFLDSKRVLLQRWINRICTHPILSSSSMYKDMFLATTDDKRYAAMKKEHNKDEYIGGKFFYLIGTPSIDPDACEKRLDTFVTFTKQMEISCMIFEDMATQFLKNHVVAIDKQYERTKNALVSFGQTFEIDPQDKELSSLYTNAGMIHSEISDLFKIKCVGAMKTFLSMVREYSSILKNVPDIMLVQKTASQKVTLKKDALSEQDMQEARDRANVVTATLVAEVAHFHKERSEDFNDVLMEFLKEQMDFHKETANKIEKVLKSMKVKSTRSKVKV